MEKRIVKTDKAPAAIGPYSQAVTADGLVFASGQIALDPASGQLAPGGVDRQTEQVLRNLSAVLEAAGSSLDLVIKTTIYLANMDDFATVNEAYGRFFSVDPPARATVEVSRLPKGALVEIDAIALVGSEHAGQE